MRNSSSGIGCRESILFCLFLTPARGKPQKDSLLKKFKISEKKKKRKEKMIRCIKIFMKFRFPYFLQGTTFFFLPIFFSNTLLSSWNKSVQKNSLLYAFPRLRGKKTTTKKTKNKGTWFSSC